MAWRSKEEDLKLLESFLSDLKEFQKLKTEKWEKIDEHVQMDINPGTPSEDWIIPPDENKTLEILEKDHDYQRLRGNISKNLFEVKECSKFLRYNSHHDFDWVKFTNPLIGNAALEDAIADSERLLQCCNESIYFWKNCLSVVS